MFHRAILSSGSSLAHSAIVVDPLDVMKQVADHTHCPLNHHLPDCLRQKDIQHLMDVSVRSKMYSSPIGPHVDGTIVPDHPEALMKKYSAKHDLMFGMTESEAFHLFPAYTAGNNQSELSNCNKRLIIDQSQLTE